MLTTVAAIGSSSVTARRTRTVRFAGSVTGCPDDGRVGQHVGQQQRHLVGGGQSLGTRRLATCWYTSTATALELKHARW